jgi:glutaredoxin-related protein
VNDSNNRELLQQYPVSYIPASFIMDKNGKLSFSAVGVLKQDEIRAELDKVVSN